MLLRISINKITLFINFAYTYGTRKMVMYMQNTLSSINKKTKNGFIFFKNEMIDGEVMNVDWCVLNLKVAKHCPLILFLLWNFIISFYFRKWWQNNNARSVGKNESVAKEEDCQEKSRELHHNHHLLLFRSYFFQRW